MASHHRGSYLATAAALLLAFLLQPLAASQWQRCGTTSGNNFTTNSTYQANIRALSAALPKSANSSRTLFASASAGAVPDMVYALALCRGDANASACGACVSTAFQDAQQLCPYNKEAAVYYESCYLRFSNTNFLASTSDNGDPLTLMNTGNVTAPVEVFDAAVTVLLNATADYAAANSSRRFGTGVKGFETVDKGNPEIYGLAQCTPDMAPADCRSCLGNIIALIPQHLSGRRGGRILGVRCNYRYEQYSFFTGPSLLQLPAPSVGADPAPANATPPPVGGGSAGNGTIRILAITLPIVATILAALVICLCLWRRKSISARKASLSYPTNPEDIQSIDSLILDLSILRAATDNFDESNRLGEGGFGVVYKGVLPDNVEIAVKRLSQSSRQGIEELKN